MRFRGRRLLTGNVLITAVTVLAPLALLRHFIPLGSRAGATTVERALHEPFGAMVTRSIQPPLINSTWTTPIVIVPAVWKEWDNGLPTWALQGASPIWSVFAYQRRDPSKPLYAPNFGYEGAIYMRFIVDHYYDLPDFTAFIQADVPDNGDWLYWLRCINGSTRFLALPNEFIGGRES
jgi:hypothetical protein